MYCMFRGAFGGYHRSSSTKLLSWSGVLSTSYFLTFLEIHSTIPVTLPTVAKLSNVFVTSELTELSKLSSEVEILYDP